MAGDASTFLRRTTRAARLRTTRAARPSASSERDPYDVAIVGGGPAGSAAALVLARAGRRVVVFERATMPRDKVCGDLLGIDAVAHVRRIGFAPDVLEGAFAIDGAVLHGPDGARYGAREGDDRTEVGTVGRAYAIRRRTFDAALLAGARAAGARVRYETVTDVVRDGTGRVVGVRAGSATTLARATIAADGWGSVVSRALGIERRPERNVAVAMRAYVRDARDLGTRMHFFINRAGDGYGWLFPLANGDANVGLGYLVAEETLDLPAAWSRFTSDASDAAPYLRDANVGRATVWPIPIGPRRAAAAFRGVFLAGDAATLASPISGSGIANALASGETAARYALRVLAGDEGAWSAYARRLDRTFRPRLQLEAWFHRAVATPHAFERAAPLLRVPGARRVLSRAMLALG